MRLTYSKYRSSMTQSVESHRISLTSFKSTVATLSDKQLSTDCLFPVSILPHEYIDVGLSQLNRTSVEDNSSFMFEPQINYSISEYDSLVICSAETHWTFTANIQLHTFMTTYMSLRSPLWLNVYWQIVWLHRTCLEMVVLSATVWAVSALVRLSTSESIH